MKLNFACKRFHALWNVQDGGSLSEREEKFLADHRLSCQECDEFADTSSHALSMLRLATLEAEVSAGFEDRVVRKLRVQTVRESLNYWTPALVGAGIACVAIVATLQIASSPAQIKDATLPAGEVKREAEKDRLPNLILEEKPHLDQ